MPLDLFAQLENENVQDKVQEKESLYKKVLDNRKRPVIENKKKQKPLKKYTADEALASALEYFKGDSLAADVWVKKYALKDSQGNIYEKSPDDMHHRLAGELARIEQKYPNPMPEEYIYNVIKDFKYIVPQGSHMAGIGNNLQVSSLSNCFVIGNEGNSDSYGGIMKIDQEQVQLMKRRGGVGHDLSHIRPKGSPVNNTAITSTGVVPFMERYSNSTREVAQDGRRGALMLSISIKHPDSEDFIDAKLEQGKVTGANVSVKIDHDFMKAVVEDKEYVQQYPIDAKEPLYKKSINAKKLWEKIIHNAWSSAEPGILFWDTIIQESLPDCYKDLGFQTMSTNPCGEIPLCPYDSCRLLALNLYSYVENPFSENASFDSSLFAQHVHIAQRLMDDIIDLEIEKIDRILEKVEADPESDEVKRMERVLWENIRQKTLQGRRTGIGITAEGDMLAALGVRYGSKDAITFSTEVHKLLAIEAYDASANLAKERGRFPIFDFEKEKNNPFLLRIKEHAPQVYENIKENGRRNIALLTIAPTGSVSICTQTTSGIEPLFTPAYKRRRKVNPNEKDVKVSFVDENGDSWEEYDVIHHKFRTWMKVKGYDEELIQNITMEEALKLAKKSPYHKATSQDIDWVNKVKMQGSIQKWVDHSISVTVNLPEDISEKMVGKVYKNAWKSGCKGITIYREGSRAGVLITDTKTDETEFKETTAPKRPEVLDAEIVRFRNNNEKWIAVVGLYDGRPYEVFTGLAEDFYVPGWVEKGFVIKNKVDNDSRYDFEYLDRQGYRIHMQGLSRSFKKEYWNYAKLISAILRHGMPLPFVVNLVDKLTFETENINTWKKGVARALKRFIPDGTVEVKKEVCPQCKKEDSFVYMEGCLVCNNCSYSKCG